MFPSKTNDPEIEWLSREVQQKSVNVAIFVSSRCCWHRSPPSFLLIFPFGQRGCARPRRIIITIHPPSCNIMWKPTYLRDYFHKETYYKISLIFGKLQFSRKKLINSKIYLLNRALLGLKCIFSLDFETFFSVTQSLCNVVSRGG